MSRLLDQTEWAALRRAIVVASGQLRDDQEADDLLAVLEKLDRDRRGIGERDHLVSRAAFTAELVDALQAAIDIWGPRPWVFEEVADAMSKGRRINLLAARERAESKLGTVA